MAAGAAGHQEGVSSDTAVFDASPLIIFQQIGYFDLLRRLFLQIVVPPAVVREVAPSLGRLPPWIDERTVLSVSKLPGSLDDGERAAIALAMEITADVVVLDDLPGRRVAAGLGMTVIGSLGLLIRAREQGLIEVVRPVMDQRVTNGLFVSKQLYREILMAAGEVGS